MVEWKELGKVCTIKRGKSLSKADKDLGDVPFILYGELYTTYGNYIKKVVSYTSEERACKAPIAKKNDLLLPISSTTKEAQIGKASALVLDYPVHIGGDALILSHSQNAGFLVNLINGEWFEKRKMKCVSGTTVTHLSPGKLADILIPIPSLSEQNRIVDILDTFTSSIENLKEQIAQRRKQFEYYRNKMFGDTVDELLVNEDANSYKVMTIAELGSITRGKRFTREDVVDTGVPALHYGDMYTYYGLSTDKAKTHLTPEKASKMRFCKKGDVVIVGAGENDWDIGVGVVWLKDEKAAVHDACYILEHEQNPMYISHYLRSNIYHLQLRKYVSEAKICSFSAKDLGRILIPIPSIEKQRTIVQTLDTFESCIKNLEAQLELRQKQYDYYRNKLLTFE